MNAADWISPGTHAALTRLTDIEPAQIPVRRLRWVRVLVQSWVAGIGLPGVILVRDPAAADESLIVHELVHVHQWRQLGALRFLRMYVGDYLRGRLAGLAHRDAYSRIRLETEARAVTARVCAR